jgi:ribose 5-phosphate isomerase A
MAVHEAEKMVAAQAAAAEIRAGMVVGLGTGSTVAQLIPVLAARVRDGLCVHVVATSLATAAAAEAAGLALIAFEDRAEVDLTIDGVDEIDPTLRAIKGAGGALLREKIVATASRRMVAIADSSKSSAALGRCAVPVEILPFAREFVLAAIRRLGAVPALRETRSDQGNCLADCRFADLADPARTAAQLAAIPGLLGHGLFLSEIDALYIAQGSQARVLERSAG